MTQQQLISIIVMQAIKMKRRTLATQLLVLATHRREPANGQ